MQDLYFLINLSSRPMKVISFTADKVKADHWKELLEDMNVDASVAVFDAADHSIQYMIEKISKESGIKSDGVK